MPKQKKALVLMPNERKKIVRVLTQPQKRISLPNGNASHALAVGPSRSNLMAKPKNRTPTQGTRSSMNLNSAPAAYGSAQRTTFYRVSSQGDDIIVHCRDRLPIVELDTTVAAPDQVNHSGRVLLETPMNPASLGERLRRLSANYEFYRFERAIATYEGATGSSAVGSLLGFFDQDPVDGFDAGKRSLAEAASHPGAHSIKVWENGTWVMPPRIGGRYYIEDSGNTAADRRLQEQGVFRIMLDIPIGGTIPTESHYALGSVYMEYTVRLMKPALQANFVGTCDLLSFTGDLVRPATTSNIIEVYNAADIPAIYDNRSNAGTTLEVNATTTGATIAVSEGLWNIGTNIEYSLPKAAAGSVWEIDTGASTTFGGTPGNQNVNSQGTSTSASDIVGIQGYEVKSTTSAAVNRIANTGCQMLVPSGSTYYFTYGLTLISGADALTVHSLTITFSSAFPTQVQHDIINPDSSDLASRIRSLESKLSKVIVPTYDEGKRDYIARVDPLDDDPFPDGIEVLSTTSTLSTPRLHRVVPRNGTVRGK